MPYIATDLDAFDDAQAVAGAIGLPPPQALGGLALTWRWCWRNKSDRVTAEQLAAFFCSASPGLAGALTAFGFLATVEVGVWRVRGVDRYLRLSEARRRGGLAAKSNLVPGARQRKKSLGTSPEDAQNMPGTSSGLDSALSAKVEGRIANDHSPSENPRAAPAGPVAKKDPPSKRQPPADPRVGGDATYKALVSALFVLFRENRGADYVPSGKDWKALARLREKHEGSEVIRRFGIGLQARYAARCSTFWDLEQRWNACAQPEASGGPGRDSRPKTANEVMGFPSTDGAEEWDKRLAADEARRLARAEEAKRMEGMEME